MEVDDKFQELKSALKEWQPEDKQETTSNDWLNNLESIIDFSSLTSYQIPSLTTAQLSTIQPVTINVGAIGGGGGSGGSGIVTANTSLGAGQLWQNTTTTTGTTYQWHGTNTLQPNDIVIRGRSLGDTLERIERTLGLLDTDEELEKDWDELRILGEQYRDLKQRIEDKMATFERLKR